MAAFPPISEPRIRRPGANQFAWVVQTQAGSLTHMKSLIGALLAIMAINNAPGLPAGTATYLTVGAAVIAAMIFVATRGRRRHRNDPVTPPAAPQPPIVQHIYTTQPVYTAIYHAGDAAPQPTHMQSERVSQVILPNSIYHAPRV